MAAYWELLLLLQAQSPNITMLVVLGASLDSTAPIAAVSVEAEGRYVDVLGFVLLFTAAVGLVLRDCGGRDWIWCPLFVEAGLMLLARYTFQVSVCG